MDLHYEFFSGKKHTKILAISKDIGIINNAILKSATVYILVVEDESKR